MHCSGCRISISGNIQNLDTSPTRQVSNLFQDLWNRFPYLGGLGVDKLIDKKNFFILKQLGLVLDIRTPPITTGMHQDSRARIHF